MSTALGLAARRLSGGGGALRQVLVSRLGQRRLIPRFTHTEATHAPTSGAGKTAESDGGVLFKRIGQRKEELYELMTEAHEKHGGTGQDWKLFRRLSAHVEPRPNDPTWVSNRSMRRNDDRLRAFGIWHCGCGLIMLQFWVIDKFRAHDHRM